MNNLSRTPFPFVLLLLTIFYVFYSQADTFIPPFDQGYALQFQSLNQQFVTIPPMAVGGSFSIEFLIRWRSCNGTILYLSNTFTAKDNIVVRIAPDVNNLARIEIDICTPEGVCSTSVQSIYQFPANVWTYVAIIVEVIDTATSNVTFYVQGSGTRYSFYAGGSLNVPCANTDKPYGFIGKSYTGNFLDADLDEFRIWSTNLIYYNQFAVVDPTTIGRSWIYYSRLYLTLFSWCSKCAYFLDWSRIYCRTFM
jgi:hypothetical protein